MTFPFRTIIIVAMGAPGGIGRYEQETIEALSMLSSGGAFCLRVLQLAAPSTKVAMGPARWSAHGNRRRLARAFVATLMRHPDASVIFTHVHLATLVGLTRPLQLPKRYIVVGHGIDVWSPLPRLRRWALRRATVVVSVSSYTAGKLIDMQGIHPERLRLVPCTYRLPHQPLRLASAPVPEQPTLLTVTRLERVGNGPGKGVDLVIRAMPSLLAAYPALHYAVIGDGDGRLHLEALARELGVLEHVEFRGFVPDNALPQAYAGCDIFVLPSGKEGFGIVYLEAMHAGKPVVAASAGGVPDVVVDGETGLLVPYGDLDALAAALLALLGDAALRRRLGAAGQARLEGEFSFERFITRWADALSLPPTEALS